MKRVVFITLASAFILTIAVHWANHTAGGAGAPPVTVASPSVTEEHTGTTPPATEVADTPIAVSATVDNGAQGPDVGPTSPMPAPPAPDGGHDDGDEAADRNPPTAAEVATGWALERWRNSWDPDSLPRGALLGVWSTNTALIDAATAAGPHADVERHGTISAVARDVTDLGDGWCTVALTVKTTVDGQIGVATTTATVTVHIDSNGLVDADRDLPS